MIDWATVDLDAPYSPHQLKVGDRVRVRLSGECRHARMWRWGRIHEPGHDLHEDGRIGSVCETPSWIKGHESDNHDIGVIFDRPFVSNGENRHGAMFAACELEPLEDT